MLVFITVLALAALGTQAAPQTQPEQYSGAEPQSNASLVTVISQTDSIGADGSFNNSFEASNGIKQQNTGFLKKVLIPQTREDGTETGQKVEGDILVQTGSYSYPSPDGTIITITYVADENGFQPVGDHIPTPPAIPAQILDSLKKSAEEASQQQVNQPGALPPPVARLGEISNEPAAPNAIDNESELLPPEIQPPGLEGPVSQAIDSSVSED